MQKIVLIKKIKQLTTNQNSKEEFNVDDFPYLDKYLKQGFFIENAYPIGENLLVVLNKKDD